MSLDYMPRRKSRSGFSLIEVLVALLVLSLGMLGVGASLYVVHRTTTGSYQQQQSVQLAANILARMRHNPIAAKAGAYDVTYTGGAIAVPTRQCDPGGSSCTTAELADYGKWQWLTSLRQSLADAHAIVATTATGSNQYIATVTVSFDDSPAADATGSPSRRTIQLETLL